MDAQATGELLRFFHSLPDPRARNRSHSLADVLGIAVMAVLCGCEGWAAVEAWGLLNIDWLKTFLGLRHGVPSHDTFDRVFGLLDPLAFEKCFTDWTATLVKNAKGLFIAVDGKTLRRSWKRAWSKTPMHLVSAFACKNQLVLGQLATDSKSNEITAIPQLLAMLSIAGCTVTIDAMGCQREIAGQILKQEGHYLLAVKENQPTLFAAVKALLDEGILEGFKTMRHGCFESHQDKNSHGRIETRRVWVTDEVNWLGEELLGLWPGLRSIVVVESLRQDLGDLTGKVNRERRYYICSHGQADNELAGLVAEAIRGHWGVENALHWRLDVSMREDESRIRMANGAENFSRLRRIALNKLRRCELKNQRGKSLKAGIRLKQQCCGWSREFLLQALLA
jgi:predicted transposase YbfD/YdcC